MGGKIYVGAENVARKPSGIYVGVNNVAKKVKAGYIGVGGVAKKFWPFNLIPDTRYQSLSYLGYKLATSNYNSENYIRFGMHEQLYDYNIRAVFRYKILTNQLTGRSPSYDWKIFGPGSGATEVYYDNASEHKPFAFYTQLYYDRFLFRFEYATSTSNEIYTTTTEQFVENEIYTIDFNNNNNVYIYNNVGYYSIPSHNLVGSFTRHYSSFSLFYPIDSSGGYMSYSNLSIPQGTVFYSAKFYRNNTLIKDIIPCYRVSDNLVGIYDFVNRTVTMADSSWNITNSQLIYSI